MLNVVCTNLLLIDVEIYTAIGGYAKNEQFLYPSAWTLVFSKSYTEKPEPGNAPLTEHLLLISAR